MWIGWRDNGLRGETQQHKAGCEKASRTGDSATPHQVQIAFDGGVTFIAAQVRGSVSWALSYIGGRA